MGIWLQKSSSISAIKLTFADILVIDLENIFVKLRKRQIFQADRFSIVIIHNN